MTVLVLGLIWVVMSNMLAGADKVESALPADLVVDGQVYPEMAAFFGPLGTGTGVSVEALVKALGGTVEPAGSGADAPVLVTIKGKQLLFFHGTAPNAAPAGSLLVDEISRHTAPTLGWYWSTGEVKDYLKLIYPDVTVATAFDRDKREGRGIFIETKPLD